MAIEKPYKCMATFRGFGKVLTQKFLYLQIGKCLRVEICIVSSIVDPSCTLSWIQQNWKVSKIDKGWKVSKIGKCLRVEICVVSSRKLIVDPSCTLSWIQQKILKTTKLALLLWSTVQMVLNASVQHLLLIQPISCTHQYIWIQCWRTQVHILMYCTTFIGLLNITRVANYHQKSQMVNHWQCHSARKMWKNWKMCKYPYLHAYYKVFAIKYP